MTDLHDLIFYRDLNGLLKKLRKGNDPNIRNDEGETPLHFVALRDEEDPQNIEEDVKIARILLLFGANVDEATELGNTALHFAIGRRNSKMIDILVKAGADIDMKDNDENSGLHYAVNNCLLFQRIDPDYNCPHIDSCADLETVNQILEYNPKINAYNKLGETPLILAVMDGDFRIVQAVSNKRADQNQRDKNLNTALHHEVEKEEVNVDIVKELIRHGSNPNIQNIFECSPWDIYLSAFKSLPFEKSPFLERKKRFDIIKMFLLKTDSLTDQQVELLGQIGLMFVYDCRREIFVMKRDKLTCHLSVYHIVNFYNGAIDKLAPEYLVELLEKSLTGKYQIYRDIILSCFPRRFLCYAFAEICKVRERVNVRSEFLNYDIRFFLAKNYLSPFDI